MKYQSKIIIEVSLAEVMTKLLSQDNMKLWMKGFKSYELLEGDFFQKGTTALLTIDAGIKKLEMIETVLESDLPFSFKASYQAQGATNIVSNVFEIIDDERTLWTQESELSFESFALKSFSGLIVSVFKKISQSTLKNFKSFVETN